MATDLNQLHTAAPAAGVAPFISGSRIEIDGYVEWLQANHPAIGSVVDDMGQIGAAEREAKFRALDACQDFSEHGRGRQWATTIDQHMEVRRAGAGTLLRYLTDSPPSDAPILLDVFGGAGFIAQFARTLPGFGGTVITSDPSVLMVRRTLDKRLPALWQRAQDLFMTRSASVDGVLFAYGTHHIPVEERLQSFHEALRVLRPGGVFVCHDFAEDGPTARWFAEVVDPYTETGHQYDHFSAAGLLGYYAAAGFVDAAVVEIDDCFQFSAPDRAAALDAAIDFMGAAYGLEKLERSPEGARRLWQMIRAIFPLDEIAPPAGSDEPYQIVIHRPALLGVGRRPPGLGDGG